MCVSSLIVSDECTPTAEKSRPNEPDMDTRDPYRRDVAAKMAAHAHEDAEPDDREAALRHGRSRRSMNRYRRKGPPQLRDAQIYLMNCPNPFRAESTLVAARKQAYLRDLSDEAVVERLRELVGLEKAVEGEDNAADARRDVSALDRALLAERDTALNSEKSALWREVASRPGLAVEDVLR